jgi:NAD(P)-dependent dehydrogenase (short-subunit alcohol dehydrogenase family)
VTADYSQLPHEMLGRIAARVINEVKDINCVVSDITSGSILVGVFRRSSATVAGERTSSIKSFGTESNMAKSVCAVIGVGPGNGTAITRRFARADFAVAMLARSTGTMTALEAELPDARGFACDVADAASIARAFTDIRAWMGEVETLVYNAGPGIWGSIEEVSPAAFEDTWRVNALGTFLVAREVIPAMKAAGHGNIVIVSATAARRGKAHTAAFAPAKAAQRSLAEAMAKHLWPAGIHVALVIIDGVVDLAANRKRMPHKPDDFFVKPDDVAETIYWLTSQPRSAWAFEVEARPFGEVW